MTFYLDHVEDGTTLLTDAVYNAASGNAWANENIVNTHDVWIGDFIGRVGDQMTGDIDAVRFSTGTLAPSEFLPFTPGELPPLETIEHIGVTDPTWEDFTLGNANASTGSVASDSLWSLVRLETGQHVIAPNAVPGDANNDGIVNNVDATILAANWQGTGKTLSEGDFNGDGIVNDADATILASNWQTAGTGASVPEPSLFALLLSGLFGMLLWRHYR